MIEQLWKTELLINDLDDNFVFCSMNIDCWSKSVLWSSGTQLGPATPLLAGAKLDNVLQIAILLTCVFSSCFLFVRYIYYSITYTMRCIAFRLVMPACGKKFGHQTFIGKWTKNWSIVRDKGRAMKKKRNLHYNLINEY